MMLRGFRVLGAAASTPVGRDLWQTLGSVTLGVQRVRMTGVVGVGGERLRAACVFPVTHEHGGRRRQAALLQDPIAAIAALAGGTPVHLVVCGDRWPAIDPSFGVPASWADRYRVLVSLASHVAEDASRSLAALGARIERLTTVTGGHAVALEALANEAVGGRVVLLASTAYVDPFGLEVLSAGMVTESLPTDLVPGEVGVGLLLEPTSVAEAEMVVTPPAPLAASDAVAVAANVLCEAAPEDAAALAEVWADTNGERWRARAHSLAQLRSWGRLGATPELRAPARSVGDVGAAAGALQLALGWAASTSRGRPQLVTAQNRDGSASAALLRVRR